MNTKTLSELEDKYIGKQDTPARIAYEKEVSDLMIGFQVRNARLKLDLTQEELAERINKKRTTTIGPLTYIPTTSGASSELVPQDDSQKLTLPEPGEWKFTAIYGVYVLQGRVPVVNLLDLPLQSAPGNTNHIASRDFSVATATQTVEANTAMPQSISLGFKHKLSALQLRITNQTGEALGVREIRLSADEGQIAHRRFYDIATGDWGATGEAKRDYLLLGTSGAPVALPSGGTESQDFHMLLFPGYENETLTVTVITDRGEYSRTRPAPDGGFLAGKNYLTNITLRTDGLTAEEKWVEYISNKAELIAFRDKVNNRNNYSGKTVRLTADIDLANETWTTPIGNGSNNFRGTFDGGGYLISKLSVDNGSNGYAGLFGNVDGGTVRNLRVSGTVTTTGNYAGGIAGILSGGTVENCIFDGDVSGNGNVGGIAGYCYGNSRIAGCHTKGKVTGTATLSQNAGGIAGLNMGSTIDGCYSEAEVTTSDQCAGGIAGTNQNGGTLTSCAAFADMTLPDGVTATSAADGIHGTALPAADCLTTAAYTSRDFPEATATTPGWAFSAAAPWMYLPWNTVFEDWNIPADTYRISVPAHLTSGGPVN